MHIHPAPHTAGSPPAEPLPSSEPIEVLDPDAEGREKIEGAAEAGEAIDPIEPPAEPPPRGPTLLERMQAELLAKDEQLKSYIAAYKHAQAEMEAQKERLLRDRKKELVLDRMKLARELLEVLDNLERSLAGIPSEGPTAEVRKGLGMVRGQFLSVLQGFGAERMQTLGGSFDATLHEALGMVPASGEQRDQQIIHEDRAGYTFDGKLLRAARVLIASKG